MSMNPTRAFAGAADLAGLLSAAVQSAAVETSGRGTLAIAGAIDGGPEIRMTAAELEAVGMAAIVTATPWSMPASRFEGPRLDTLLTALRARGDEVVFSALDGCSVTIRRAFLERYGAILAMRQDGWALSVRDRGPFWLMLPFDDDAEPRNDRYYDQAIWRVSRIEVR